MSNKQKLELTWIGKDERPKLEPRILIEDPNLSYCGTEQKSGGIFDNVLIKGDNLLALKALEQEYAGKVKCVFIDPPYNTGSAFEQYDDGMEHSLWLSLMKYRLELLRLLLSENGSIWITIDDNEMPYLRILVDEIFGRSNFVASVIWQKRIAPDSRTALGGAHDYILVYAKNKDRLKLNPLPLRDDQIAQFKNPDNDPRGLWTSSSNFSAQGFRKNQMYKIVTPGGAEYFPPEGRCWVTIEAEYKKLLAEGRMWFGQDGKGMPRKKTYLAERDGQVSWTWWGNDEVGHTQESKKESIALFGADKVFATPKPERLLYRILALATNGGDLVLDSFAGSGTTGAVAHKCGRRWIMVELGEHAETHVIPRLQKVVDGSDAGGVTDAIGWQGGGGFRYYTLAPSLLEKDKYDNWVISKKYDANMLAAAVCKLMGFTYEPSQDEREYWRHGHSTETDFIYITTQSLTYDALKRLSEDVGRKRTLLVCCKAYNAKEDAFDNITLGKIPQVVLKKCEWGRDDYSLKIAKVAPPEEAAATVPPEPDAEAAQTATPEKRTRKPRKKPDADTTPDMFAKRVGA